MFGHIWQFPFKGFYKIVFLFQSMQENEIVNLNMSASRAMNKQHLKYTAWCIWIYLVFTFKVSLYSQCIYILSVKRISVHFHLCALALSWLLYHYYTSIFSAFTTAEHCRYILSAWALSLNYILVYLHLQCIVRLDQLAVWFKPVAL